MPKPKQRPTPKVSAANGQKTRYVFPVMIEKDADGYFATCPSLHGCSTQGDSYEEALANIREAVEAYLESLQKHGEKIPRSELASFTTIEVMV